ncbi:MAG: hypothetical protein H6707_13765 [Deltaproteobacteria bacterium]|nr:hypothetical protein [Deltaproteobacteria bacterium]
MHRRALGATPGRGCALLFALALSGALLCCGAPSADAPNGTCGGAKCEAIKPCENYGLSITGASPQLRQLSAAWTQAAAFRQLAAGGAAVTVDASGRPRALLLAAPRGTTLTARFSSCTPFLNFPHPASSHFVFTLSDSQLVVAARASSFAVPIVSLVPRASNATETLVIESGMLRYTFRQFVLVDGDNTRLGIQASAPTPREIDAATRNARQHLAGAPFEFAFSAAARPHRLGGWLAPSDDAFDPQQASSLIIDAYGHPTVWASSATQIARVVELSDAPPLGLSPATVADESRYAAMAPRVALDATTSPVLTQACLRAIAAHVGRLPVGTANAIERFTCLPYERLGWRYAYAVGATLTVPRSVETGPFMHEATHVMHRALNLAASDFEDRWLALTTPERYGDRVQVNPQNRGDVRWLDGSPSYAPRYGFAYAYGNTSALEDVATFVESSWAYPAWLRRHTEAIDAWAQLAEHERPYVRVYIDKLQLLSQYGLLPTDRCRRVLPPADAARCDS